MLFPYEIFLHLCVFFYSLLTLSLFDVWYLPSALEHMRAKIELSTERIQIAKKKEEQARKVCHILYASVIIELV